MSLHEYLERLLAAVTAEVRREYEERLVSLVVFRSIGRGTSRPNSDLDLLVVADPLPRGRLARLEEFEAVERGLTPVLAEGRRHGFVTECSPCSRGWTSCGPVVRSFSTWVDDARVLHDRDGTFAAARAVWRERLTRLGAPRIWRGNAWLWDLTPDYQPGDVFDL